MFTMSQKNYSCKLRREIMEAITSIIDKLLIVDHKTDDDKLLMCNLYQVRHKFLKKLVDVQKECKVSLTAAEAFALRILSTDYVTDKTSSVGNRLHQISNEVHRLYQ